MVFFENAIALNDFSMSVNQGEIVGVIGSNSAGKTTLMNTISGLIIDMKIKEQRKGGERITLYGEIIFQGEDISETQPYERVKKGLVLSRERHPIFPESDVVENLKIAGHQVKKSALKDRMDYVYSIFPALVNLKSRKAGFLNSPGPEKLSKHNPCDPLMPIFSPDDLRSSSSRPHRFPEKSGGVRGIIPGLF